MWKSRILGQGRVALDWIWDINRIPRLGLRRVGLRRIGSHWIRLELGIPLQSKLYILGGHWNTNCVKKSEENALSQYFSQNVAVH